MIEFINVNKEYNHGVKALDNINIKINKGEFVFLVGPSGSGKSTFLKLMIREEDVSSGKVIIDGSNVSELKPKEVPYLRRKIGFVFQDFRLLYDRTVAENIEFALRVIESSEREIKTQKKAVLEMVGLTGKENAYPNQLSGGMRQRVALIRTLATRPSILLLDEAFSALDYQTRIMVTNDIFQILKNEKITAVMVTHDISEAISMSDRVVVLTNRPGTVNKIHEIDFEMENRNPINCRESPKFSKYFDTIWKELDVHV